MPTKTKCLIQPASSFLFFWLLCSIAYGQTKNTTLTKIYFQAGAGPTNHSGISGDLAIQGVLRNRWTATFSFQSVDMEPKNLPKDFNPGATIVFFIPIEGKTPSVDMKLISLTAGRYIQAGRNSWFTTEAGLSFVRGKKLNFTKNTGDPATWYFLFFGDSPSNYSATQEKRTSIGAMLKADFNWAFASFMGLGGGVFANFNSIQSPVGFQLKLIVGKTNRERNRKY